MGLFLFLPNFFSAGLAVVASRTLYELRTEANRARQMGSYQLVELLGRGGMGEVWRATHRMLARPAAIKLVSPEVLVGRRGSDARGIMRRFRREAQITAQLTSAHTIQLFDFGVTDDGILYYVMELLDGVDLETLVQRSGPLSVPRTVYLLSQICESLAEAHAEGLVHRDMKPANVYVCKLGTQHDCAKVLDFGLVSLQQSLGREATRLTGDGQVTGTPAYMAPELVRGDGEPDERVDVYALGCVAYFMLTGSLVFDGDTPLAVLFGHVEKEPERPSRRAGRELPADFERVIMDCLSKDPADRPRNAAELNERLASCDVPVWTEEQASRWWAEHGERVSKVSLAPEAYADTSEFGLSLLPGGELPEAVRGGDER
jgi:serine/threonine-protein kinase